LDCDVAVITDGRPSTCDFYFFSSSLAFPLGVFLPGSLVQYISPLFCFKESYIFRFWILLSLFFWFVLFWGVDDLARCCYTIAALMTDMIRKVDGVIL